MRYVWTLAVLSIFLSSTAGAYRCYGPRSDPPDYATVRKEAEGGKAIAQFIVGKYYDTHFTISSPLASKSKSEAVDWYIKSANQGYAVAQQKVGFNLKATGNYEDAFFWVSLGGHAEIAREIARDNLSTEQIARINKKISEWHPVSIVSPTLTPQLLALKEKAEAGNADAQIELGDAFAYLPPDFRRCDENERMDDPIFRNLFEAEKWWGMAAEQGHVVGQAKMANAYRSRRDYAGAIHWFTKAAEQGNGEAARDLSLIYEGKQGGVPTGQTPNYEEAYFWLLVSGALDRLGPIKIGGKNVTDILSSEKIAAVKDRFSEWRPKPNKVSIKTPSSSDVKLKKLAEGGDAVAQYSLGMQYASGPLSNFKEAERWYLKSAQNGFSQGQYFLARLYIGKQDYSKAEKWLKEASEQGHNAAQTELSGLYRHEDLTGVTQNLEEAYFWISVATLSNGQYRRNRDKLGQVLSPEQRETIQKRAGKFEPAPTSVTTKFFSK